MSAVKEWNQQKILAEVSGRLLNGMDRACSFAAEQARAKARRRTGKMAELVDYEVVPVGDDVEGRIGSNMGSVSGLGANTGEAFYWYFIELGTKRMPAYPFVRPAVYDNAEEIVRLIGEG